MRKCYLTILLALSIHCVFAQQSLIVDNEFVINPYVISPSYSGFNGSHEVFANYINHFTGTNGAPSSEWADYNGLLKKNFGIGASLRYEQAGAFRTVRADLSFAYHLHVGGGQRLSIGLGVTLMQNSLNFNGSNADPMDDFVLNSSNTKSGLGLNASFGITYAWRKLNITLAAPGIIPMQMNDKLFIYSQPMHLRAHVSYDIAIDRLWSLKPQILVDYVFHAPINYCGVLSVRYNNLLWLNLGIGAQSILSGGLGILIGERFAVQYTFKDAFSGVAASPYGSHEICLGILIGKVKTQSVNNSIFSKKYKSPYHEWE
jgi:type IX secretion system PorP/SprF family membrane protein